MPKAPHVIHAKLSGLLNTLRNRFEAGSRSTADKKGTERELFVQVFLEDALPPLYRVSKGDISDLLGHRSGCIDLVVENPLMPSLTAQSRGPRHFIAEGVAVCIEVKSNLKKQWGDVERTAHSLWPLHRCFGETLGFAQSMIPLIAVGFKGGWTKAETMEKKMRELRLAGLLSLDPPIFVANQDWASGDTILRWHDGPEALWAFATRVLSFCRGLQSTSFSPEYYSLRTLALLKNILVRTTHRDTSIDALSFFGPTLLKKPHPVLQDIDMRSRKLVGEMLDELAEAGVLIHHGEGVVTIHAGKLDDPLTRLLSRMPLMNIPLYTLPKTKP